MIQKLTRSGVLQCSEQVECKMLPLMWHHSCRPTT